MRFGVYQIQLAADQASADDAVSERKRPLDRLQAVEFAERGQGKQHPQTAVV